jgi:two-component system response regulator WspF
MKVGIVNDLLLARTALRRVLANMPGYNVVWTASNGAEAVQRCVEETPDLVLMDLIMPGMDGVEATRRIMTQAPCPVLVVTASVGQNADKVVEALAAGALDAVKTPVLSGEGALQGTERLVLKIEAITRLVSKNGSTRQAGGAGLKSSSSPSIPSPTLIAIGASAGGPAALATICRALPAQLPAAIVVVQHIDAQFAPSLATWLNEQTALSVRLAREHDQAVAGTVLIAGTNDHLVFLDGCNLGYTSEPRDCHYRPSVDVFFNSVARLWKGGAVGVLLTGMGRDGAKGLKALRQEGVLTIAQDEASSVVYGMPKAAAELGAAVEILPLSKIAVSLVSALRPMQKRSAI